MIELTLGEVAQLVGGALSGADAAARVTGTVEFDSRQIGPGGLFVAFDGEQVDGHDYVGAALAAGAVAAVVTRPVPGPVILVDDALQALARLAAAVVRRLPELTVVGITGSSGKTSTKDLVAQLLAPSGPTVAPPGSFNNELGHPWTVLRATAQTRFLVLEKSARGVGHIRYLTDIAPPHIAAVLNVGSAHLGEFGSRQAIAQAKGELVEALPPGGVAILNADDPFVIAMRPRTAARVVTVGLAADADLRAGDVSLDAVGRPRFTMLRGGERADVALQVVGAHQVGNALAAAAIALECGVDLAETARRLSAATAASRWRMELTERADGVLVVNDAYNANPESMTAALETLARVGAERTGTTRAVLGPMAELGPDAEAEHAAIGRRAVELGIAHVLAVGEAARPIRDAAALEGSRSGGAAIDARWVPDVAAALELLADEVGSGDVVLVKASRSARLERIAAALTEGEPGGSGQQKGEPR